MVSGELSAEKLPKKCRLSAVTVVVTPMSNIAKIERKRIIARVKENPERRLK
jgi:hypothetical protein